MWSFRPHAGCGSAGSDAVTARARTALRVGPQRRTASRFRGPPRPRARPARGPKTQFLGPKNHHFFRVGGTGKITCKNYQFLQAIFHLRPTRKKWWFLAVFGPKKPPIWTSTRPRRGLRNGLACRRRKDRTQNMPP